MGFLRVEQHEDFLRVFAPISLGSDFGGREIDFYHPKPAIELVEGKNKILRVIEARGDELIMEDSSGKEKYVFETVKIGSKPLTGRKLKTLVRTLCGTGIGLSS